MEILITLALLLSSLLASGLGNSLQPIAALAFCQPLFSLLAYDRLLLLHSWPAWASLKLTRHLLSLALLTIVNAIGGTIAFSGVLSFPTTTVESIAAAFGFALATSLTVSVFAILGNFVALAHWGRGSTISVITFPCLYLASYSFMSIFISSFVSPGNAMMDYEPLRQMCCIWGLSGTVFLMASTVCLAYLHIAAAAPSFLGRDSAFSLGRDGNFVSTPSAMPRDTYASVPQRADDEHQVMVESDDYSTFIAGPSVKKGERQSADFDTNTGGSVTSHASPLPSPQVSPSLYRASVLLLLTWTLVSLIGGLMSQSVLFYQRDITTVLPSSIRVSCLIESSVSEGTPGWERLWNRTQMRINHHRDDLILWAEESLSVSAGEGEQRMLDRVSSMLANQSALDEGKGSYVGIAYQAWHEDQNKFTNHFVLFEPSGVIAWNYLKAYPVPIVENDVVAGPPILPTHDSRFGRLTGAICFDLDHPHYALQAAKAEVDIFLQPSWTWGSVGPRHWIGNQVRAIEGGYNIIRCSSSGVSGSVSSGGLVTSQYFTGEEQEDGFSVPLFPRRWTPYSGLGFHYVEWVNLAAAVLLWTVLMLYRPILDLWARYEMFLESGSGGGRVSAPKAGHRGASRRLVLGKRAEALKTSSALNSPHDRGTPSKDIGLTHV